MLCLRTEPTPMHNQPTPMPCSPSGWLHSRDTRKLFRSTPSSIPFKARDRLPPCQYWRPTGAMSMNIFRLCGDMSHVFSIIVLLLRLRVAKNASGEWSVGEGVSGDLFCVCVSCVCAFILADVCRKTGPQHHTVEMRYASLDGGGVSMWVSFFPAAAEKSCLS